MIARQAFPTDQKTSVGQAPGRQQSARLAMVLFDIPAGRTLEWSWTPEMECRAVQVLLAPDSSWWCQILRIMPFRWGDAGPRLRPAQR